MAKQSMDKLTDKYFGFVTPEYKIKINESDFNKDRKFAVTDISVELTAGYEASACSFTIIDGVSPDAKKKGYKLDDDLAKKIKVGNQIEVHLGYRTSSKKAASKNVFKGFISSVELQFHIEEGFCLLVESMDVKKIMMNNKRSRLKKDLKKYSDAVDEVLKDYAKLIDKRAIDKTQNTTMPIEQHNQSDYDFVVWLSKKVNYAFYVINGKVHFEPLAKDKSPIVELKADDLNSFTRETTLSDQISQVTVRMNNEIDPKKNFESTAKTFKTVGKGKKSSADVTKVVNKKLSKTILDPSVGSVKEAKYRADAELKRHSMQFATGTFECIGIPEIIPGKMLTISGFGDGYDNDYYISKVTHQLNQSGYIIKGELGVNKI